MNHSIFDLIKERTILLDGGMGPTGKFLKPHGRCDKKALNFSSFKNMALYSGAEQGFIFHYQSKIRLKVGFVAMAVAILLLLCGMSQSYVQKINPDIYS